MNYSRELLYQLALKLTPKVGAVTAKTLISYCGSAEAVFTERVGKLMKIPGIGPVLARRIQDPDIVARAENEYDRIISNKIRVHFYNDSTYPFRLKNIHSCPILIYGKGNADLNAERIVAIVGTRRPTPQGRVVCERLVDGLSNWGVTVVSGLAYGIDIAAHRMCLQMGMPTIGVMANGLKFVYPAAHRGTARRMTDQGALLTEFEYLTKPEKDNFPARNRIIAALADATLVIESGVKGGSMITADFANDFSREVLAVPGRISDQMSGGCHALIKKHKAHLCESADDVAYLLQWDVKKSKPSFQGAFFAGLSDIEQLVYDHLDSDSGKHIDILVRQSNLTHGKLASVLLSLECKGLARAMPGKTFLKIT